MSADDTPLLPLSQTQRAFIALGMVAMGAAFTVNFVVVAPLAREAGFAEWQVALALTSSAILYAGLTPFWGGLSQRFGRRAIMAFSLFAMGATNILFLFTLKAALAGAITGLSGFATLVFARMWFGLLSPGMQPAAMSAMTDATTPATRTAGLGFLGASMNVGSIAGPVGAALLAPLGALMPIWGSVFFCWICAALIVIFLPADHPDAATAKLKPKRLAVTDARVRPHLLFLLAYFTGIGTIQQTVSWFIQDRYKFQDTATRTASEATVASTGMVFACLSIAVLITQFLYVARMKPEPRQILPIGLGLMGAGYLAADILTPFWLMCVAYAVIGIGSALAVPAANALGSLSVPRAEQGSAAALLAMAPPAGFVLGPLIGALLYGVSPRLPFLFAAVGMALLALYALRLARRQTI